jgi:hypothetical protein
VHQKRLRSLTSLVTLPTLRQSVENVTSEDVTNPAQHLVELMLVLDLSNCTGRSHPRATLFAECLVTLIYLRATKLLNRICDEYQTSV